MPEVLLVLLIVIAIVTVVGHGIWVFLAMLFRAVSGRDLSDDTARELADLQTVRRQLQRMRAAGELDEEQIQDLLSRVERYRQWVLGPRGAAAPAKPIPAGPTFAKPSPPKHPPVQQPSEGEPVDAILLEEEAAQQPPTKPQEPKSPFEQPPVRRETIKPPVSRPDIPERPPATPAPLAVEQLTQRVQPPKPPAPWRSFSEMLSAFMEERNIRWGELIGGLLIVGCSTALVMSLWDVLSSIPYFPFLVFVTISAAIFGVGLYAHHRWRLASTSRGLLVIATLLVPLNCLTMVGSIEEARASLTAGLEVASLGLFVWLVGLAAKVLAPRARWLFVLGVVGNSAGLLLVGRVINAESTPLLWVSIGGICAAVYAAAVGAHAWSLSRRVKLDRSRIVGLLTLLGTSTFALLASLGLLIVRAGSGDLAAVLDRLSIVIAIAALPLLAVGLTIFRGTSSRQAIAALRVTGTMIALLGMLALLVALGLAWPHPLGIMAVGAIACVALALAAFYWDMPVLHAGAIAAAAIVYLTGFHVVYPPSDLSLFAAGEDVGLKMLKLMLAASSGTALAGLFVVLGAAAELLARLGRRSHGAIYAGGCAAAALAGLMLVTFHGLRVGHADALRAAILYAIYGVGSLALAGRWGKSQLTYLGLGLLTLAPLWALWWHPHTHHVGPLWAAVLAGEALAMGLVAVALSKTSASMTKLYRVPLLHVCEVVAPAALSLGLSTAWFDRAAIHCSPELPLATVFLTVLYFMLAREYRSPERTWAGSIILLAGLVHTLNFNYSGMLIQPWLVALLVHSTLAAVVGVVLAGRKDQPESNKLALVFGRPLLGTAMVSSILALSELFLVWAATVPIACCLAWLAAIWLLIAWTNRSKGLLAAAQVVLATSALVGTTVWLEGQTWVAKVPHYLLLDARCLQIYGIVLVSLSTVWLLLWIALRRNEVVRQLLDSGRPTVDRVVLHVVAAAQLIVLALNFVPSVGHELVASAGATAASNRQLAACGPAAWILLGVLAAVLVISLWNRWRDTELLSVLLATVSVPCLIAGQFGPQLATASALRWGLAAGFIICSLAVWNRRHLLRVCQVPGTRIGVSPHGPRLARIVLLATTVLPVLALTVQAALLQFGGVKPGGPLAGSFFASIGPSYSYLAPLLLVLLGMVVYALRESSAGYAFAAGLVALLITALGYALSVVTGADARPFHVPELIMLLQLCTTTAAVWAIGWLAGRRWVDVWREGPRPGLARVLMSVQLSFGIGGNVLLLGWALLTLIFAPLAWQGWAIDAGAVCGWIALLTAAAAVFYRQIQVGTKPRPDTVGLVGMAVLGLLACTVHGLGPQWGIVIDPHWGYRTLMLGWAVYSLLVVLVTWWVASVRTLPDAQGPPQALLRMASVWVRIAGLAAVLLGLKLAFWETGEQLWAAAAIAIASIGGAAMAVWRRREGWAFSAALGVNLAASLVVWHYQRTLDFEQWWVRLVQANVIASSAVALVWLAARRRLYQLRDFTLKHSPLLAIQVTLTVVGNIFIIAMPVGWLLLYPSHLPGWMTELSTAAGWIGMLLCAAAAGWYTHRAVPGNYLHVLGGLGLGCGVLAACYTTNFCPPTVWNDWLQYHTLTTAWAALATLLVGVGYLGRNLQLASRPMFPTAIVQTWVAVVGTMVLLLAVIWSAADPAAPWCSIRAIAALSVIAGLMALWMRLPLCTYASGLLISVLGTVAWIEWGPSTLAGLIEVNVLCLAAGSVVWSLLGLIVPDGVPHWRPWGRALPFAHLAARVALALLAAVIVAGVGCDLAGWHHHVVGRLDWIVLATTTLAVAVCLWDWRSRFALPGLYVAGLLAVGLAFLHREFSPTVLCWAAAVELAAFVLAMAVLGWLVGSLGSVWRAMRIPALDRWPRDWFSAAQAPLAGLAGVLATWVAIDFRFDGVWHNLTDWVAGRSGGALAAIGLLAAAVLMTRCCRDKWRATWQHATFGAGVLALACPYWVRLDPVLGQAPWLHRSVILMVAAVAMILVAGVGLRRYLPSGSDWIDRGRRSVPALAGLAATMLALVLLEEGWLFWQYGDVPMATPAIAIVIAALLGAAGLCIAFAVLPELDPLGLSERGRMAYVYVAEVLLTLIGLHLWLTMPWLFTRGLIRRFWMLIVMAVSFAGAGLSEFFRRRKMPVLSLPLEQTALLLPLLPAIGFWFQSDPESSLSLIGRTPVLWFLMGLFYGFLAVSRRSVWCAVLGILAGNMGIWVALDQFGVSFLLHPQLWLIPLALAALVAEYLNSDRLNKAQSTAMRYMALSVIYISSTADMFIAGMGEDWRLPLALMLLSVLGVLAGIMLRVRSFLFLGVTFLVLDMISVIWYAVVDLHHTWILPASGIALGVAIIALFAVFEKRRNDVLAAVERLKDWKR